ncbi:hypothetical protein [Streptomyces sp. G1]|uniref:hypothetical protein n=1 Tax=Streptomyces sp. G1 TaxID=361572 RepID=UPI0020304884|nr:hypothetical protein [Streptomyces sp. G1]MCM1976493.1 hypothetical protein [Streptomyces sp. G1]
MFLGPWKIGSITLGADSVYAWSAAFGPSGLHPTIPAALERLAARWLNNGPGPAALLTATGTVHAARTTLSVPGHRAPAA